MILTDQNGTTHELNDLVNLNYILGRYFEDRYFSEKNAKQWKSKITHFCKNSGYFRERVKSPTSGFCYKIAQILPDGKVMQISNQLSPTESLNLFKSLSK